MGLKGSVRALSLDQLLDFLNQSGHTGSLKISFKDKVCVLCLKDSLIYIDQRGKGEFRLGEILVLRGTVTQEQVTEALATQKQTGGRIGDVLVELGHTNSKALNAALRAQLEEELYDLFVLEDAFFEFDRVLPDNFETGDLPAFFVRSILMEAARRFDEWKHIKQTITSRKCFYRLNDQDPAADRHISKALGQSAEDQDMIFGHERSIEETLPLLGMTQFQGLSLLAHLISEGQLVAFTPRQLEQTFREKLVENVERALKYYECTLELDEFEPRQRHFDRLLFQTPQFRDNTDGWKYSANVKGRRALQMLLSLFRQGIRCEFYARENEREIHFNLSEQTIIWKKGSNDGYNLALKQLKKERLLSGLEIDQTKELHKQTGRSYVDLLVASGKVTQNDWEQALKWAVLNTLFDLVFWVSPFVQVQTGTRFNSNLIPEDLEVSLSSGLRTEIVTLVKDWERHTTIVPSVRSFFLLTPKGQKAIKSAVDDLNLFDGRRTLEQIMRLLRKNPHEFFSWLYQQHRGGRVQALDESGYDKKLTEALNQSLIREALAYCTAAIDSGLQVQYFKDRRDKILEKHGEGTGERAPAKLEGDLASFSLPEVLQSFHMSKRSGTLRIFTQENEKGENKEKELYFDNGLVFLLQVEDYNDDFLLDANFFASLDNTFQGNAVAKGLIAEDQVEEQLREQIKEEVYDVFLWDDARFVFTRDSLPPEFFEVSARVTKYSLNTSQFLLEAVRRITEWEHIRTVVPNDELVVAFESYDSKMRSVTERGNQEVLLLIDGRHTVDEVLRISGARRFHAVKLITELLEDSILHKVDITARAKAQTQERSGMVEGENFVEVLRSMQTDKVRGVLRVTDGRRTKECAFIAGIPYRTTTFKQGTGNADVDAELSSRFYARDFAEIFVLPNARYQLLENVLPPVLETEARRGEFLLNPEIFLAEFLSAGKRWEYAVTLIDRDKPLKWIDENAGPDIARSVPAPANVTDWIDGRRSAEDIIRAHPDGRYLSFVSVGELFSNGVLVYADPPVEEEEDWDFGL